MAKGGHQRRRIQQKHLAEKAARRRARRRRTIITWSSIVGLIALIALLAITLGGGNDADLSAKNSTSPSPSPSPSGSLPPGCTRASLATDKPKTYPKAPAMGIDKSKRYTATMKTSCGTITMDLLAKDAPKTVNNFVFLAREGFYDGSPFHRVIAAFGGPQSAMVQGGDAVNQNGTGDAGYKFGDENLIPFTKAGYIAMANSGPQTNGSQFFLLSGTVSHLNRPGSCPGPSGCHSVFGKVTKGLDVLARIAAVPIGPSDRPAIDVVLEKVTITQK